MITTLLTFNFFILYFTLIILILQNVLIIFNITGIYFEEYIQEYANWFLNRIRFKLLFYWAVFVNVILLLNNKGIDPFFIFLFIASFLL